MNTQTIDIELAPYFRIEVELDKSSEQPIVKCEFYEVHTKESFLGRRILTVKKPSAEIDFVNGVYKLMGTVVMVVQEEGAYFKVSLSGDLQYGASENTNNLLNRVGTLAIFDPYQPGALLPGPTPDPEPCPEPMPIPEEMEGTVQKITVAEPFQDLFPYLDMEYWPELEPNALDFISISISNPAENSLYEDLITQKNNGDGSLMLNDCTAFLGGTGSFQTELYPDLKSIPLPYKVYPLIYRSLQDEALCTPEILIAAILAVMPTLEVEDVLSTLSADTAAMEDIVQNYIALNIIQGYHKRVSVEMYQIIVIDHAIRYLNAAAKPIKSEDLQRLIDATILLPESIFPIPKVPTSAAYETYKIVPYAVGHLQMTRFRHLGYSMGEISHIENLMPGETKKLHTRELNRIRALDEQIDESANTNEVERDGISENLVDEVAKTISEYVRNKEYKDYESVYGPPTSYTINGNIKTTFTHADPNVRTQNLFVKKILDKTLNQIRSTVQSKKRLEREEEHEEKVMRILDNSQGKESVRAIYRWLNRDYEIRIDNYGKRLILEIFIENPAENYIESQKSLNGMDLEQWSSLASGGIKSYADLTPENYFEWAQKYHVKTLIYPPEEQVVVFGTITSESVQEGIEIPKGYQAKSADLNVQFTPGSELTSLDVTIGNEIVSLDNGDTKNQTFDFVADTISMGVANRIPVATVNLDPNQYQTNPDSDDEAPESVVSNDAEPESSEIASAVNAATETEASALESAHPSVTVSEAKQPLETQAPDSSLFASELPENPQEVSDSILPATPDASLSTPTEPENFFTPDTKPADSDLLDFQAPFEPQKHGEGGTESFHMPDEFEHGETPRQGQWPKRGLEPPDSNAEEDTDLDTDNN